MPSPIDPRPITPTVVPTSWLMTEIRRLPFVALSEALSALVADLGRAIAIHGLARRRSIDLSKNDSAVIPASSRVSCISQRAIRRRARTLQVSGAQSAGGAAIADPV